MQKNLSLLSARQYKNPNNNSMHYFKIIFGEMIILRGLWPPNLPDLNT
jgi:hypothetical protein